MLLGPISPKVIIIYAQKLIGIDGGTERLQNIVILFTIDQFVFLFLKCPHILSFIGSIAMENVRQTQKISVIDGGTENRCFLVNKKKEKVIKT